MIHSYKTEGIVLKRTNLGEADRILTFYTKHYGKIRAIGRGIRKITSRKAASLEIFNHILLVLTKGKNLDVISETNTLHSFRLWRKDLLKVGVAYYFCELVDKLTAEGQEHYQVFNLLLTVLSQIEKGNLSELVINFEKNLLRELGFGIPHKLEDSKKSLKNYIEEITEKTINSPRIIREIW